MLENGNYTALPEKFGQDKKGTVMFTYIVGSPLDPFVGGLALVALFVCGCVYATNLVWKYRSRIEINNDFTLAKIRLANEDAVSKRNNDRQLEYDLVKLATEKDVQYKRIESGMIEGKVNKSHYDNG